jgi:hypothetical protein
MSFGSVTNDYKQHIWGAAAYSNQQAASIGVQEKSADFKNTLEETEQEEENLKSFGFGSQNSDGSLGGGISAMLGMADDMLSQLQFNFLKNNSAATSNSVKGNMNAIAF